MNPILVIGATGTVGRQVVSRLAATGTQVRAMARNPGAARCRHRSRWCAEISLFPRLLMDAWMASIRYSWCGPPRQPLSLPLWSGSRSTHGASYSSQLRSKRHTPSSNSPIRRRALAEQIERLIETSGLQWTFLRPGMFAANALRWWAPQIRAGDVVRWPYLAAPTAPIDERDIAAVAVRALCEDGHAGAEYVLTGPQSLSQFEQVSTIGRVIGRSLRIEEISPDEARRELLTIMPASS